VRMPYYPITFHKLMISFPQVLLPPFLASADDQSKQQLMSTAGCRSDAA
jgi:hypothetical protein